MSDALEAVERREDRSPEDLRERDFFWFVTSCFLSSLSRNGYFVSCSWLLVADGFGSAAVAIFFIVVSLTELATSNIAGWLSDKFDRRWLYIVADTVRSGALCCLAISIACFEVRWPIWISGVVVAACDRVGLTASQASIPSFPTRLAISTVNSLTFFFVQCGGLIGALVAGYSLHSASPTTTVLVLAIAFGSSAAAMSLVARATTRFEASRIITGRMRFSPPLVLLITIYALLYTGSMLVSVVGPGFVLHEHSGNAIDFGRLESAWSIGSIVGTILLIPLGRLFDLTTYQAVVLTGMVLAFAILPHVDLASSLFVLVALGALYNFGRVTIEVMLQTLVPVSALGRAKGVLHCAAVCLGVIVFALIGLAGDHLRPSDAFLGYSIFSAVTATIALTWSHFRRPGR